MKDVDRALHHAAAGQRGLVHRKEAVRLGLTLRQVDCRVKAGVLVPVQPHVYRIAAVPTTWEQSVLAACMAAGAAAVASHRAAAVLWGLRGVPSGPAEITAAGRRLPQLWSGVVVHRAKRLEAVDVTTRNGVPVTAPALTLLGLAAVGPEKLEPALEDALLRGLVSHEWMVRSLARLGGRGRCGSAALGALLSERSPGGPPTESPLEDAIVALLRDAGLPDPVRQHRVGGVRIDLAYPAVRLGIEADGRIWHGGRLDVQRNSEKANTLVHHGWRMLHFTRADAAERPSGVVDSVLRELSAAGEAVG